MNLRLFAVAALLGLVILIAACGPEPQIRSDTLLQDTSLITGEPCGPPCWRGIIPGETTWSEAMVIIQDDPTLDEVQTRAVEDTDQIVAAWAQQDGDGCCQMFTEDGETVDFVILQIVPSLTLDQVIEEYGEPTYLVGETLTDSQGVFHLLYPEIPMVVYAFFAGKDGVLSATSEIVGVGYMTDGIMQQAIDLTDPGLQSWEGYQTFQHYDESELEVTPIATVTPSASD